MKINKIRWSSLLTVLFLMGASMSGCGNGIFNTEPFVDAKRDEQGNVILRDTPRMWTDFVEITEMDVASEKSGRRSPGGHASWNAVWLAKIHYLNEGRENASKYITYIIESRRHAGLPELEGYPKEINHENDLVK